MDSTYLRFASYNSQGSSISRMETLKDISRNHDVILVQEHWLHSSQLNMFENNIPNMCSHGVSSIKDNDVLVGRPHGGVACLWRRSLKAKVTPLVTNNERICAIRLEMIHITLLIICVYMPCDTNSYQSHTATTYCDVLQCINDLCANESVENIVLGGDFNTDLSRQNSVNCQLANASVIYYVYG